jgi:hypothetical protein
VVLEVARLRVGQRKLQVGRAAGTLDQAEAVVGRVRVGQLEVHDLGAVEISSLPASGTSYS